jgi:pSer/pThr/pTyr-binding forkhead associated (FHA) protein
MWILKSNADAGVARVTFRINDGTIKTIGRAPRAEFVIDAAMVSRLQCRLTASANGGLEVLDLSSTNGTFVNGRRVRRSALVHGDRLRVGRVELIVERKS